MGIKRVLPLWLKKPAWYIVKSRQRTEGIFRTVIAEIFGNLLLSIKAVFHSPLKPISICTGLRNRTSNYLDYVVDSVLQMEHQELIELSIYDCGSEDYEALQAALIERWKGKLKISGGQEDFTRSHSFNQAIKQASGPIIFASDADMTLPDKLVALCNRYVTRKSVWFPTCFSLFKDKPAVIDESNGRWRPEGRGMFACYKKQFIKAGGFNEDFKTWGYEDWDIWHRFWRAGYMTVDKNCRGLFHNYHPSLDPSITERQF